MKKKIAIKMHQNAPSRHNGICNGIPHLEHNAEKVLGLSTITSVESVPNTAFYVYTVEILIMLIEQPLKK